MNVFIRSGSNYGGHSSADQKQNGSPPIHKFRERRDGNSSPGGKSCEKGRNNASPRRRSHERRNRNSSPIT